MLLQPYRGSHESQFEQLAVLATVFELAQGISHREADFWLLAEATTDTVIRVR